MTPLMVEKSAKWLENRSRLISIRGRIGPDTSNGDVWMEFPHLGRFIVTQEQALRFLNNCIQELEMDLKNSGVKL